MKKSMLLTGCLGCVFAIQAQEMKHPNIIFILADDYGWRDMSCTGSDYYETPNLDRLATYGTIFTQGYAACQVSSPSRASILTGKYPPRHDITNYIGALSGTEWRKSNRQTKLLPPDYAHNLGLEHTTLAEALKEGGYATFFAGKWHLGDYGSLPEDHGFDYNIGGWKAGAPTGGYFSPYANPNLPDGEPGEELSMRLAQETIRFIKAQCSKSSHQPFFAFLSFYAVHSPIETTRDDWRYFRDKADRIGIALDDGFVRDGCIPVRSHQDNPVYAGLIRQMDRAIGVVLDELERLNLLDDTLIVFTSDNGGVSSGDAYQTSNFPLRGGKGKQWEGGIRVPLIIKMPNTGKKTIPRCEVPVIATDLYPTILDAVSLPLRPKDHLDGISIKSLLYGGLIPRRALFWHYPHYGNQGGNPSSIIRKGDWKLIYYHEDGHRELYNLSQDPYEKTDVSHCYSNVTKRLWRELDAWMSEVGATVGMPDPEYSREKSDKVNAEMFDYLLKRESRLRRAMLRLDWQPNETWWGSCVTID